MKRVAIIGIVLASALGLGVIVGCIGLIVHVVHVLNSSDDFGSSKLAGEWTAKLRAYTDLDDARAKDPRVQGAKLPNGEWVFGYCNDSHGKLPGHGGGTVVVRDSRGEVRVFFGHVCGDDYLQSYCNHSDSLDVFYKNLSEMLVEQPSK